MSEEQNIQDESTNDSLPAGQAGPQSTENALPPARSDHSGGDDPAGRENISEENIQYSIPNTQSSTEIMEVHKHPHHVTHKKQWGEYFLEFIMIFLAVTLGFFAESYREYIGDREKEKKYMESMVRDLERDTTFLNTGFLRKQERLAAIDSVFDFFESHHDPHAIPGYMVVIIKRTSWDRIYDRNSGTINQLRSTGGMRLIQKKGVADSIAAYDFLWERDASLKQNYIFLQNANRSFTEKIFNPYDLLHLYRTASTGSGIGITGIHQLDSVKINIANLDEFLNFLSRQKTWTTQDYEFYKGMNESATRLIAFIKKEYNIK